MNNYSAEVKGIKFNGDYIELTVEINSDSKLYFPRISVCFCSDNDNRILPMDLKFCEGKKAVAIGIYDIPSLFYNKQKSKEITVKILFSDGKGCNTIIEPEKKTVIPLKKRSRIKRFINSSKREKEKLIFSLFLSFLFLPYRRLKVQPNKVTFLTNRSDRLSGNIKAVFHEMTKLDGVEIVVLSKKGDVKSNMPNLFRFFKEYATSKVIFVDDYYHFITFLRKKEEVTLIQLWHACGAFKTFGFSRLGRDSYLRQGSYNHRQYDYVIVSSKEVIPYYAEGFGVALDKVIPLGSPRCDALENEQYIKLFNKKFYKMIPELKDKKILLFAPTFRGGGMGNCHYPVEKFDIDKLLSQLDDDWCVVIKMHPYLNERPSYSQKFDDRVFDMSIGHDINDLLFVTDLLVTDYSSTIFEASIVNVPMIFYAFDLNEYSKNRDFYCNFSSFVPGKVVLSMDEMIEAINNQDYKSELIAPFRERYFDNTAGKATDNVVSFTKELLEKNDV